MDGYFKFLLLKVIMQKYNDLYFILPDPPNLQEIAKRADNQYFRYSRPKPAQKGASQVLNSASLRI